MIVKEIIICFLFLLPSVSVVAEVELKGCTAKEHEIREQIEQAKMYGNVRRMDRLGEALKQVQRHCTDEKLLLERQQKVQEKELKVSERTHELEEARLSGRTEKIAKKMRKLDDAEIELDEAIAELNM
ncbi:DUF1090 domain-containing protein [Vibrio fluvialis]